MDNLLGMAGTARIASWKPFNFERTGRRRVPVASGHEADKGTSFALSEGDERVTLGRKFDATNHPWWLARFEQGKIPSVVDVRDVTV